MSFKKVSGTVSSDVNAREPKKTVLYVSKTHGDAVEFLYGNFARWQDEEGANVVNRRSHNQGTDVPRSPNR